MSDHSDAMTPEQKEFVERGRQFQEWLDESGFGVVTRERTITYKRQDGEQIAGDYGWVTELEYFEGDDRPVDLIKETWVRQAVEVIHYLPPGVEEIEICDACHLDMDDCECPSAG